MGTLARLRANVEAMLSEHSPRTIVIGICPPKVAAADITIPQAHSLFRLTVRNRRVILPAPTPVYKHHLQQHGLSITSQTEAIVFPLYMA